MKEEYFHIRSLIQNIQTAPSIEAYKNMIENFHKKHGQEAHDEATYLRGYLSGVVTVRFPAIRELIPQGACES